MEQLRVRVERFRKQRRLQDYNLDKIIKEMRESVESEENTATHDGGAASDEHKQVMEAVKEGLLQVHGVAPNTKTTRHIQDNGRERI